MQVTETKTVTREIYVAPCLKCGGKDIRLSDSNYSSFNTGGGWCKAKGCGHEATGSVSCSPTMDDLAGIWNAANDIPSLIKAQEATIATATQRIGELNKLHRARAGTSATPAADAAEHFRTRPCVCVNKF